MQPAEGPQNATAPHLQLEKEISFNGLTIELFEDEVDEHIAEQQAKPAEEERQKISTPGR